MKCSVEIISRTGTARDVEVVAGRVGRVPRRERVSAEPCHEGGHVHRGALRVEAASWAEGVVDLLRAARRIGHDLHLTCDVERDMRVIVGRLTVCGVARASLGLHAAPGAPS